MRGLLANSSVSLYRGLAVPFSVFVLVASLLLAGWISYWIQRDALRQFLQMAVTNAKFVDELQLPRSPALAQQLSTVLGAQVGFYGAGGENQDFGDAPWPGGFKLALEDAVASGSAAFHYNGYEVAVAPFEREAGHLVLLRETRSVMAIGLGDAVLMPTIILTLVCGCLAYYLAHRIVRPLAALTDWLPHLQHDGGAVPPIPSAVSQRGDEIGELARSLEVTHQRLRDEQRRRRQSEHMAALGRIATSLAHEIRNPASSIRLHADLLYRDPDIPHSESIALIRSEVDRITDLVNQWLFVVRPAPPQSGRHDLVGLVSRIAESLRAAMEHAGAAIRLPESAESLPVNCDHSRIEQVVRNLLVNAMQAMPEGGDIRIHFEASDDYAVCIIHDSGAGFSEDALQRFGEPFFSEREGGMGIGLTLAREVIEAHDGNIEATNAPTGGAMIRVQLPLAPLANPNHS